MENMATWWWIHWMMLSPGSQLPVWWILLNELSATEFDDELAHYVVESALERSPWEKPSASSIDKDISAFIRTYAPSAEEDAPSLTTSSVVLCATSTSYGSLRPDTGSQPENHANSPQKSLSQQHSTMWPSPTPQVEPSLNHVSPTNPEHPARPSD